MLTALRRALIWDGGKKILKIYQELQTFDPFGLMGLAQNRHFSITPNNEYVAPTEMLL